MARILVVDDESLIRVLVADVGESLGHEVLTAASIKEGQDLAQRGVDIVLLDVLLPDGDGLAHVETFSQLPGRPDVIIITGHGNADAAESALRSGAWEYLVKPLRVRDLSKALTQAVQWRNSRDSQSRSLLRHPDIIGESPALAEALEALREAAASNVNVLITGETGTGKELFAQAMITHSQVPQNKVITQNCAAVPENLMEAILFGTVRGAYTGAENKKGLFEEADGGVLFLDELNSVPFEVQSKLLRVLQEGTFMPLGSNKEKHVSVKVIAAMNVEPMDAIDRNILRRDLFYRFSSGLISIPPLRERREDIGIFVNYYLEYFGNLYNKSGLKLSHEVKEFFWSYSWDGNVREMKNVIESMITLSASGQELTMEQIPTYLRECAAKQQHTRMSRSEEVRLICQGSADIPYYALMEETEKNIILEALRKVHGNKTKAAEILGLPRQTLNYRMQKLEINEIGYL